MKSVVETLLAAFTGRSLSRAHLGLLCLVLSGAAGAEPPSSFRLRGTVGASVDRGGANFGIGAHFRATEKFLWGLQVEWNPWFDVLTGSAAAGAANLYAQASWVWVETPRFEVKSTASLGTSTLLFSPLGARRFATGLYAGFSIFNLTARLNPTWAVDVTPELALPVPSLGGVPFAYLQYRVTLGLTRFW